MYVSVKYIDSEGVMSHRDYTYSTELELALEDVIDVPVRNSYTKGMVVGIDLPAPPFPVKEILSVTKPEPVVFRTEDEVDE